MVDAMTGPVLGVMLFLAVAVGVPLALHLNMKAYQNRMHAEFVERCGERLEKCPDSDGGGQSDARFIYVLPGAGVISR